MTLSPLVPRLLIFLGLCVSAVAALAADPADRFRGGTVEWTRLDTNTPFWDRHSESDTSLIKLMRQHTSLNISSEWKSTKPNKVENLCRYPFIYCDNIEPLSKADAANLGEYLRRGGFLLVDACGNKEINPSPEGFFNDQIAVLRRLFPDMRVVELPQDHEIFTIYFTLKNRPPRARPGDTGNWLDINPTFPLRAVYDGDRMIAIVALNGFQCAWSFQGRSDQRAAVECMAMVTNIYIYAMTR